MRIVTALSTQTDVADACRDAASTLRAELGNADIGVCLTFASGRYGDKVAEVPGLLTQLLDPTRLIGCSAGGVIGGGVEVEGVPALCVTAMELPGVTFEAHHLIEQELPDGDAGPRDWIGLLAADPATARGFIVIPDPFTFPTQQLLRGLDFAYPETPKIGGLASGGHHPGTNALYLDQTSYHEGAVVLSLSGDIEMETIVAQGCRPFGDIGQLTRVKGNTALAIDSRPAIQFLQEQLETLPEADLVLARTTPLFLGIAMDAFATAAPGPGEFLVRNLIGVDPQTGGIAVAAELGTGRHVQFHLRDGQTSDQDLRGALQRGIDSGRLRHGGGSGALLFSCLGRGESLYGHSNHDSDVFRALLGRMPLAGFFCNGEIGPVMGSTHIHGYTSAIGLLRERKVAAT